MRGVSEISTKSVHIPYRFTAPTMSRFSRLTSVLVILFHIPHWVLGQGIYNIQGEREKALYGYSFFNITDKNMEQCLGKCLENCLCLSFQICEDKKCQLCSSNKNLSPQAFKEKRGCYYFGFQTDISQDLNNQCHQGCSTGTNCCLTSDPCKNGGTCEPSSPTDTTKRFRCTCPPGYVGDHCEHPAKSCRSYTNGTRIAGKYKIFDGKMRLFEVFCDFDVNTTMVWTLIQSYQLQNNDQFKLSPLHRNKPVHEDNFDWNAYRLSKPRMESIRNDSSKWRFTCRYDTDGVNYTDYVRASIDKIDIVTYDKDRQCKEVEYIDIRGHKCPSQPCTIVLYQSNYMFHTDTSLKDCDLKTNDSIPCDTGEDNFGHYVCTNPAHRCSATQTSTTQTWFGGE